MIIHHTLDSCRCIGLNLFVPQKGPSLLPFPSLIVYREGDLVKQPMKKGSFVPKMYQGWGGVGWGGVGHEGVGWGVSYRGGVGWVMKG